MGKKKKPREGQVPEAAIAEQSQRLDKNTTKTKSCQGRRRHRTDFIEKPAYWAVIPAKVRYDPELPANAKLLYAEISSLTDQAGYCFASNSYFENLYGLSKETIVRLLRILEARGYIQRAENSGGKSQRRIYAGINPAMSAPPDPVSKITPPGVKNDTTPVSKMTPISEKNIKKSNNTPQSPPGGRRAKARTEWLPEEFEKFWEAYPRGDDKKSARKEWDRLKPDHELIREMSAVLERMKKSDEWRRGIGIPYLCRWLSHRRWEDEVRDGTEDEDSRPAEGEDMEWL